MAERQTDGASSTDELILAFDLGTGGCKSSLWAADGTCVAEEFVEYPTTYPGSGMIEQRPAQWWDAVAVSAHKLLSHGEGLAPRVRGISSSGQSLGVIQLDAQNKLLSDSVPIWSDTRGDQYTSAVFERIPEEEWYLRTGNGFPAGCYPVLKTGWMKEHEPEKWAQTRLLIGSKDYINLLLTGEVATDHSYASGSGAYSLRDGAYDLEILAAAGLDPGLFPEPIESHEVVGVLTSEAASLLGLEPGIPVFAGAVDNSCMALGSKGTYEGSIYAALGSSSWMTVTTAQPILDVETRPYVFRHAIPGFHVSALSTFSSGTSLEWLRELICPDLSTEEFINLGLEAAPGASGALFLPMLSGGTPLEGGPAARGSISGLELGTKRRDISRAALEGIAFALRRSLDHMRRLSGSDSELLISGGGARSAGWNQIYADILDTTLTQTSVDQQAATLGAAAIGFVGLRLWSYADAATPHTPVASYEPGAEAAAYEPIREKFDRAVQGLTPED